MKLLHVHLISAGFNHAAVLDMRYVIYVHLKYIDVKKVPNGQIELTAAFILVI